MRAPQVQAGYDIASRTKLDLSSQKASHRAIFSPRDDVRARLPTHRGMSGMKVTGIRTIGAIAAFALACGGDKGGAAGTPATQTAAAPVVPTHAVRMELVNGKYRFAPATLTIKPGDMVRWINVSGGPHNVAFKKDKVPAGAQDVLNAAMAGRLQDLFGPFVKDSLATYDVSFAGAPAGTYGYTCTPHELMGMVATLTVRP